MKLIIGLVIASSLSVLSIGAFAESNTGFTRAQVRAELRQYEQAGYNPNDWLGYPENFRAAREKLAAKNETKQEPRDQY
jgi:hypothetical protein